MAFNLCFPSPPCSLACLPSRQLAPYRAPRNLSCVARQVRTTMKAQITSVAPPQRRSANWQPSLWDYDYIQSLKSDYMEETQHRSVIEKLKEDVRRMIDEEKGVVDQLELIDALRQLGVGYHFDKEIKDVLASISVSLENINMVLKEEDLNATALLFRLLREHGFGVSQDVFDSFKNEMGSFKACLCNDTKGMLSLYEASYFGFEGENTLDEARAFTTEHLKALKEHIDPCVREQVAHALELPLNWRMPRLHTRWFIDVYERREENMNPMLLEFAKLDFNVVQSIHRRDLREVSRWWKKLCLGETLEFARDRLMESYLWAVGWSFEPMSRSCRETSTRNICLITAIDDIYDVYGWMDELELFTSAVDRWDTNAIEQLPDYMKICYLALFNTINEVAYEILKEKGLDIIPYLKKTWADLCKAYLVEAKWYHNQYTPTLEEYLDNAWISISAPLNLVHAYFFLSLNPRKEALKCLEDYSQTICLASTIFRLVDDLETSTGEMKRGDVPKAIQCYMHEKGVSEAMAREHIKGLISSLWKKFNADLIASPFEESFKRFALNVPRMAQCAYRSGDGFGEPDSETKDQVISLLIEPIP